MIIRPIMRRVNGWWGVGLHVRPYQRSGEYRHQYLQAQKHAKRLNLWIKAGRAAGLAGPLRCPDGTTHIMHGDDGTVLFYRWDVTHHVDPAVGEHFYGWFWWNPTAWSFSGPGLGRWGVSFVVPKHKDRMRAL